MLVELKKAEFDAFAEKHSQSNFQQSSYWAKFMEQDEWHSYLLGYQEKNEIIAATVLLSKDTPFFKKRYFYAPRGFLIDYKNEALLTAFTKDIIDFIQQKKGIYLKIDPYLPWYDRDKDGNLQEGGQDNTQVVEFLEKIGFSHVGNDFKRDMVQPRWLYRIDLRGKTIEELESEMSDKTRQIKNRNAREGIHFRFLPKDELASFVTIMKETSDKYHTLEYTSHFYDDLFAIFPKDTLKMAVVELHTQEAIATIEEQLTQAKENYYSQAFEQEDKQEKKQEQEETILRLEEKLQAYQETLQQHGDTVLLGGYFLVLYGKEIIALHGGILEEWKKLDASITLHDEVLKYAKENHYDFYNLYEISGNFDAKSPMYGSYLYKRNFGGKVIELIGEFDYIIDATLYRLLRRKFPAYYGIKTIRKEKL